MSLLERLARPCMAVDAKSGDRCTRTIPHAPDGIHSRGAHTFGARDPRRPAWLGRLTARETAR